MRLYPDNMSKCMQSFKKYYPMWIFADLYLYLQLLAIESRVGYDCEDRQPCKYKTSQKSPDVLFDSVLIIQFVALEIDRSQTETTIAMNSSPWLPLLSAPHSRIQKGAGVRTPLKNHKSIGFLRVTGPYPLKNHKASKPASMLGHHPHISEASFKWLFAEGPMMAR